MSATAIDRSPVALSLERALGLLGLTVAVGGAVEIAFVVAAGADPLWAAVVFVVVGWIYAGAGLLAWYRRPSNGLGAVMVMAGVAWLLSDLNNTGVPALIAVAMIVATVPLGAVVHLVLALPSGRLASRAARWTVVAGYGVCFLLQAPLYLFTVPPPPFNVLSVADLPTVADLGEWVQRGAGALVVVITGVILVQRLRSAAPGQRRVLAPLYAYGVLAVLAIPLMANVVGPLLGIPPPAVGGFQVSILAGVPVAFVIGVLRGGFARTGEDVELAAVLGARDETRPVLRDALARTLGDPTLRLVYSVAGGNGYVDDDDAAAALPAPGGPRAVVEVRVRDRPVGAIVYDGDLIADPEVVRAVGRVVAIAMEREQLTVELRASEDELRRSRQRVVEAADRERRRLAQDMHDGLQVRLVVLGIEAEELASELDRADQRATATALRVHIDAAAAELRRLVHAVLPATLVERGLSGAAEDLVDRMPVPTRLQVSGLDRTLPAVVESTAYFVVAEALTNALKHGRASAVDVRLTRDGARLLVEVRDDGVGGAHADGRGLRGLADRVDVLGGRFRLESPRGQGTLLRAELPCGS